MPITIAANFLLHSCDHSLGALVCEVVVDDEQGVGNAWDPEAQGQEKIQDGLHGYRGSRQNLPKVKCQRNTIPSLASSAPSAVQPLRSVLESSPPRVHSPNMSTKEIVADLLQKLPDNVTLRDVAQEIEFVAGVRQGLHELDNGERIPIEEIEREMPSWVIK